MSKQREIRTVNDIKEETIIRHLKENTGKKVFILTEAFPFMFIGEIKEIVGDVVVLKIPTTSVPLLEENEWSIQIGSIEVFYVETVISDKKLS